jgi:hypothetical protein
MLLIARIIAVLGIYQTLPAESSNIAFDFQFTLLSSRTRLLKPRLYVPRTRLPATWFRISKLLRHHFFLNCNGIRVIYLDRSVGIQIIDSERCIGFGQGYKAEYIRRLFQELSKVFFQMNENSAISEKCELVGIWLFKSSSGGLSFA